MKTLFLSLSLAALSLTATAQENHDNVPEQKYKVVTNSFWSNWFVQLGGDWNAWYSDQEHHNDAHKGMGLLGSDRRTLGGAIALGKWFTPGIALRTKFQIGKGKNIPALSAETIKFDQWTLNEQVMLNLSNLLMGYNERRVWNVIPFVGGGMARNMSAGSNVMVLSGGLQSTWRLSRHFNVYLEAGVNRYEGDFDAVSSHHSHDGQWTRHDNGVYGEVGFTYRLGMSGWKKAPDVDAIMSMSQAELEALNAQLADALAENDRLRSEQTAEPVEQKPDTVAPQPTLLINDVSVFFPLSSATIASTQDLVDVENLVKLAQQEGFRLRVTGYADSATGNATINQQLSEARANAVADEIVKMGFSRDQMVVEGKGGVDSLAPDANNRRVVVGAVR